MQRSYPSDETTVYLLRIPFRGLCRGCWRQDNAEISPSWNRITSCAYFVLDSEQVDTGMPRERVGVTAIPFKMTVEIWFWIPDVNNVYYRNLGRGK